MTDICIFRVRYVLLGFVVNDAELVVSGLKWQMTRSISYDRSLYIEIHIEIHLQVS